MANLQKIKTALISVFDKTGILELAQFLIKNNVKIISTGGTYKLLIENKIEAIEISDHTGFPEMMSGRLKTLHPKIHGGLLGREEDAQVMKENGIEKIDLTIVNLYPFEETVMSGGSLEEIIEKIDIGGPSMLRSSAKNFKYTTVITDIENYTVLMQEMNENSGSTSLEFRKMCASRVFALTGYYDAVIAKWFRENINSNIGKFCATPLKENMALRYGENPHQKASFYEIPLSKNSLARARKLQGKELSYNNIADADSAHEITSSFSEPTVSIIKHNNPCGLASGATIEEAYTDALKCDSKSAFGGIVSLNREVTGKTAELIKPMFYEVIIAPKFSPEAIEILSKKPNLRLLECVAFTPSKTRVARQVTGGMLLQSQDATEITKDSMEVVAGTVQDLTDAIFSFKTVKFYKSNAIVITNGTKVVAFGCGQTSRVDSMEIACKKLALSGANPADCILSSDAFFPFTDNLEIAFNAGIKTIVAPGGSVKDEEVKEFAKKLGMNLIFTKTRHFRH